MKSQLLITLILLFLSWHSTSQTVRGNLNLLANQEIKLEGFNGLNSYTISKVKIDDKGNFKLFYSKVDLGVGYLISVDNKALFVVLNGEEIEILGEALSYTETIKITKGQENKWFEQYAIEHPKREQALSAWVYLEKMYSSDPLFATQENPTNAIEKEKKRLTQEDLSFIENLPKNSYVRWFLPTRKLVSSVSTVAQYRPEEIPSTIKAFRQLDYTDPRLHKSGLFKDAIESHFWLIENSGKSLDSVFIEMQISIDALIQNLVSDEKKLNEVCDYLFDLLERHSLFQASEYLAVQLLTNGRCTIDDELAKQLETYRTMKKGNTAPDIVFNGDNFMPGYTSANAPKKLSDLKNAYYVVVFGASWCQKCTEEIPEISKLYPKWKNNNVEVVFVSLDEDKEAYQNFAKNFPFISTCDFKKWNSPIATDYYVFGTPTIYLLDQHREIILRPNTVNQLDAWVEWYLIGGNK